MIDLLLTKQKQIDLAFQSNDQRSADRYDDILGPVFLRDCASVRPCF